VVEFAQIKNCRTFGRYLAVVNIAETIQEATGCRVSEFLSGQTKLFKGKYFYHLQGKKGSSSRLIEIDKPLFDYLQRFFIDGKTMSDHIQYIDIYRAYKACGIVQRQGKGKNDRVSHSFRADYIKELRKDFKEKDTADIVGHRSQKSQNYYLK
jgi:hypothetical protein